MTIIDWFKNLLTPVPMGTVYHARKWGDPALIAASNGCNYDTAFFKTSNFQVIQIATETVSGKVAMQSSVSSFLHIPRTDVVKLALLQPTDDGYSVDQKMRWLYGKGRPYLYDNSTADWSKALSIRWGHLLFGGQPVMIDRVKSFPIFLQGAKAKTMEQMGRIVCFRKTDWGKSPVDYPYLIQRATAASYSATDKTKNNIYNDTVRGVIYSPIWSPLDWKYATTEKVVAFWVPMKFLE